jgi:hypothetical protein
MLATLSVGRGCPRPVTGRSLRPSWAPLTRRWLRFAIHGSTCHLRRLSEHGLSPPCIPALMQDALDEASDEDRHLL